MSEMRKLINKMINMDELKVEAQPGIASVVVNLMITMLTIAAIANSIKRNEMIAIRVMMISRKTEMAPNPCNNNAVKFICDFPA